VLPTRAKFAIQAAASEPADARHLEIAVGEPVLIFTQTGYDQLGRAFELARTVYRADRYLFRGTLVAASEGDAPVVQITSPPIGVAP
jgi:DNA-binding GntR family transcriptional regulator